MATVILEGDNGTGKTSVGYQLQDKYGFNFISELPQIKSIELAAKQHKVGSLARMRKFLEYNFECLRYASEMNSSVIARNWPSTIAAAYADGLITISVLEDYAVKLSASTANCHFFELICAHKVRINRINMRNSIFQNKTCDDVSECRELRYQDALCTIWKVIPGSHIVDTTNNNVNDTATRIIEVLYDEHH